MRGLKLLLTGHCLIGISVASFTDAWIETSMQQAVYFAITVASFTDAWIETVRSADDILSRTSHLLQMRGLKPVNVVENRFFCRRIFYRCVD